MNKPLPPNDEAPDPGTERALAPVCLPDGSTIEAITAFDGPVSDPSARLTRWYLVIYQPKGAAG